ncbi:MAG: hypothetical protein WBL27_09115 [Salinimicrobium sp.]
MEENYNEVHQAAEVVLLIIQNEGKIEQGPEDPSEFKPAYELLLALNIIVEREGEYFPGSNFEKTTKIGFREFLRRKEISDQRPSTRHKWLAGFAGGAILASIGYLLRPGRH